MPYLSVGQQHELEEIAAHRLQILRAGDASNAPGLREAHNFVLRVKDRLREDRYQQFLVNFPKFDTTMQPRAFYEETRKIFDANLAENLWSELRDTYLPKIDADSMRGNVKTQWTSELWCGHVFGEECITNWLRRSNSCPHCRDMPLDMPSHLVESMEDNRILEENLADMERRVDELVQEDEEPERAMNETALEQHERARRTHISHPLDQTELQYREEEFDRLINVLQEEQQRLRQHMHQLDQYRSQLAERMEEEDRQREAERRRRAERRAERMEELDRLEEAENRRGANGWRWF
ncbi:hypothetical protein Q9189_004376 [Teloschistes chrysophthalmus]